MLQSGKCAPLCFASICALPDLALARDYITDEEE